MKQLRVIISAAAIATMLGGCANTTQQHAGTEFDWDAAGMVSNAGSAELSTTVTTDSAAWSRQLSAAAKEYSYFGATKSKAPRKAKPVRVGRLSPEAFSPSKREMARKLAPVINKHSIQHGLDPRLVAAIIRAESAMNPDALSPKGAMGLMQLMPSTAAIYGVKKSQLREIDRNVWVGTKHFASLMHRYNGNVTLALAAYNAGEGAVAKHKGVPPYRETQDYIKRISGYAAELGLNIKHQG